MGTPIAKGVPADFERRLNFKDPIAQVTDHEFAMFTFASRHVFTAAGTDCQSNPRRPAEGCQ
ncbi:hypothetical protein G8O24_23480 [Bradyrhizobium sp. INPA01-394B]|uniref:Uncharacterized protein n=1 Tax=Bradyrhizobium campsiandrae TaxID=1729892 RepID=A0ABR7U326_9BRAD|nr:hypothetical protein [Bradyrhizobium campsiandrae]MBC9880292.1 hypothetical protein [Bradyrhizobium campsiandrae]MBC9978397.1 hypothetical protein [Bradyrhizobium campsiandrae]